MTDMVSFFSNGISSLDSVIKNCQYQTRGIKCPKSKITLTSLMFCCTLWDELDATPIITQIAGYPNVFSFEYDTQQDEYSFMQLSGGAGARVNTDTLLYASLDSNELAFCHSTKTFPSIKINWALRLVNSYH